VTGSDQPQGPPEASSGAGGRREPEDGPDLPPPAPAPGGVDHLLGAVSDPVHGHRSGAETEADVQRSSTFRRFLSNYGWITFSQLANAGGNIALTPFVIHGLGVERYGLFITLATAVFLFGTLNGGINTGALRYFSIYAGRDDRAATTRLLTTLLTLLTVFGVVFTAVDWVVAPPIIDALSMRASLRPEALFMVRTLGIILGAQFVHGLFQAVLNARQHYRYSVQVALACYVMYVAGLIITVRTGAGLRGVAIVFVVQQVFVSALILPAAARFLDRKAIGLLGWSELWEVLRFAGKAQLSSLATVVNAESDTLIIGGALSIRTVGFYNSGANFATQIYTLGTNALGPLSTHLGNAYGRSGPEHAHREYLRLQRLWVVVVVGWSTAGLGAAYFGVTAWLGHSFGVSGWVATVLMGGNGVLLLTGLATNYLVIAGHPGLQARFGVIGMVTNLALTVPLVFTGPIGVVAATSAGNVISALYLLREMRKLFGPDAAGRLADLPLGPGLLCAVLVVGLEVAVRPWLPSGPLGLLAAGLPALVGLVAYAGGVLGLRRSMEYLRRPRQAMHDARLLLGR
jgi:O-antigen/teichoic acid export membrane protein